MYTKELLIHISENLVEVQETLEVLEEAAEMELEEVEATADWAKRTGTQLNHIEPTREGIKVMMERIDSALADLAAIQEDIGDALGVTPE